MIILRNKRKINNNGITLIALVITIIVLLILAAVSIATLTGENGILTRANEAKEETGKATAEEKVEVEVLGSYDDNGNISIEKLNENLKNVTGLTSGLPIEFLPATVEVDGYEIMIGDNGNVGTIIRILEYQTEDTKPYLPSNNFSHVEDTNLDSGLVITDGTNNWVWIEIPKKIYEDTSYNNGIIPTGENDYDTIEKILNEYAKTYKKGFEGNLDTWYDYCGTTYDGENQYSPVEYIKDETKYNIAKEYYGALYIDNNGTVQATEYIEGTTYYAKITDKINDTSGCGLTYEEYENKKKYMISSIYRNGGFWIGQYESGSKVIRKNENAELTTPVIQKGVYPYNWITCSNAQKKSNEINSGMYTSSLMFGIQWNLILKYLEINGVPMPDLIEDSSSWGNYYDAEFEISTGEYSNDFGKNFNVVNETYKKSASASVLITTGTAERNSKMNIYDLVGNLNEWTLERSNNRFSMHWCRRRIL